MRKGCHANPDFAGAQCRRCLFLAGMTDTGVPEYQQKKRKK
jgi:hypothetical protein